MTFRRAFELAGEDGAFAAGDYLVQTDEEMIEGLSFPAWRRVATMIHVRKNGTTQVLRVDPRTLDFVLTRDAVDYSSGAAG